jgi:hypothetical protein
MVQKRWQYSKTGESSKTMYLDTLQPQRADVGYGQLGIFGSLGFEDKQVQVGQRHYPHALSSHEPASPAFQLDRELGLAVIENRHRIA